MEAAVIIKRNLPPRVLENKVLATYFESFVSVDIHVLVRFGKWNEILALPIPTDREVSACCAVFGRILLFNTPRCLLKDVPVHDRNAPL